MNKFFSFLAGAMCGAVVGSVAVLLLTPAAGTDLRAEAVSRWEDAMREARLAMDEKRHELEAQYEQMKSGRE